MRTLVILTALLLLLATPDTPAYDEPLDVYSRVQLVDTLTGVVAWKVVYAPRVDVPVDCEAGPLKCLEEQSFSRVYRLDFFLERREASGGELRVETESRGTVLLAVRFETEKEETFHAHLMEILGSLSAESFTDPYAGLSPGVSPFLQIAEKTVGFSWGLFDGEERTTGTRYHRDTERRDDGSLATVSANTSTYSPIDQLPPFRDGLASAVEDAFPEEIRTAPIPKISRETVARVRSVNMLREMAVREELVPLPEPARYTRQSSPGVVSSSSESVATDGSSHLSTRGHHETRWTARTAPADVPPDAVADNVWLSRWTMETVERSSGPLPEQSLIETRELTLALIPTMPPVSLDEDGEPVEEEPSKDTFPVAFDENAFVENVARRLDREATLDVETLEDVLAHQPAGLETEGWLLVVCRDDGTAEYGIPPTRARSRVENADLFCAALESRLD